jgi:hypothetical protein
MATAPLTYLPGESEEARAANKMYQDALKKMVESLDARKNRMFDPTLLAMAQGFLTPGRTGSFGEALGQVAGNVRAAETERAKEEQAAAAAELGIRQKQIEMLRQQQAADYMRQRFDATAPAARTAQPSTAPTPATSIAQTAPTTGAQVSQQRVSGEVPMTRTTQIMPERQGITPVAQPSAPAESEAVGYQVFQGRGNPINRIITSATLSGTSPFDMEKEILQAENNRYKPTEGGIYDMWTGKFEPTLTGKMVEFRGKIIPDSVAAQINFLLRNGKTKEANDLFNQVTVDIPSQAALDAARTQAQKAAERGESVTQERRDIPGFGGINLPANVAFNYDQAVAKHGINSREAANVIAPFIGRPIQPAAAGQAAQPAAAGQTQPVTPSGLPLTTTPGVLSIEDRALRAKISEMTAEDRARYENEQRRNILDAATEATSAISRAQIFRQYADAPDAQDMFGILNNSDVKAIFERLVEQGAGLTTPQGRVTVGIPDLQRILRNMRLSPEQQSRYQAAVMMMVQAQMKMSQYVKGAVSNYEQQLFAQAGINPEDVPGSMRIKADMITLRSEFDKDVANKLRESGASVEELKTSNWYAERVADYDKKLMRVAAGERLNRPGARQISPSQQPQQQSQPQPQIPMWNPKTGKWE